MKALTVLILISASALAIGCNKTRKKKETLTHTYKLQRPLSVSFLSSEKIEISHKSSTGVAIKIYLKKEKSKKLIDEAFDVQSKTYNLKLPTDLSDYTYIVVVAESQDSYGHKMSAVDTYKINEQELINEAKEALKNRN